ENEPWAIAVDADNVYWATATQDYNDGEIRKAAISGGPGLVGATGKVMSAAIAVDASDVYWLTNDGGGSAGSEGGGEYTLIASGPPNPGDLKVDDQYVYWVSADQVLKAPKTGGAVTKLATGQAGAESIGIDAQYVYWVDNTGGSVMRASLTGTGTTA